ncbi:hypothetical protein FJT64_008990 [Amphibalanus amphitrite]|uniref:Uncharacterized protein n=1 Tax=Amphibalanus amphitrite TaxID=1232801 RepID=A0A6A4VHN4_AMPAM|nr:hypothetical protein FJT64_008990 [Amphibalanus amphitrite]
MGDQLEAEEQLAHACRSGARSQRHLFWVRAGTVLPSGEVLLGAWSEPAEQNCVLTSEWPLAAVLGLVAGGLLLMALAVLVFCLCSRTKRKWVKMRDIGVNLPSGLERPDKGLHGFRSSDTRSGPVSAGYGRLVSQTGESGGTSGRPLLQEEAVPVGTTGLSEDTLPSTATDSNSCSSGATNYTDSGAESEKVGSPTYERLPWPAGSPHLAPYVQAGGPGSPPSGAPVYPQFSPYVDATAIQSLLAGGGVSALPKDSGEPAQVSRSEPDLSSASAAVQGPSLPYSRVGLRSSAGYVSMTSDEALPPPPPPAEKVPPPEQPYVALGPTPPASSAAGFPPYVLAGLSAEDCEPYTVQPSQSYTPAAQPARSSAYVTHDKLQPAGIELRDMSAADASPRLALAREEAVDIHQLRSGHWARSEQYLHRIGRRPTPECAQCDDKECPAGRCLVCSEAADTPAHVLLECPCLYGPRLRALGNIIGAAHDVRRDDVVAALAAGYMAHKSRSATLPLRR